MKPDTTFLEHEMEWLRKAFEIRFQITFEESLVEKDFEEHAPPILDASPLANFIETHHLTSDERLILQMALTSNLYPPFFDVLKLKNNLYNQPFTELGANFDGSTNAVVPTIETALFLIGGSKINRRLSVLQCINESVLFEEEFLHLDKRSKQGGLTSSVISCSPALLEMVTGVKKVAAKLDHSFPAQKITTAQKWDDLVIAKDVREGIQNITNYVRFGVELKNDYLFGKKIKRGYRVLFTGPPGTGKTMTAQLLGKKYNMDVYKVDLSLVVSKYIGETEKNLSRVFSEAENRNWILFFDEADALFGKRSATADAKDRYANQEVSYLLQRIEDFNGLIILCTNFKNNMDSAFYRRFQSILHFELPDVQLRKQIWEQSVTNQFKFEEGVSAEDLAEQFELSAASIVNVLHYSMLHCLNRGENTIRIQDLKSGLKSEGKKIGKSLF